MSQIYLKREIAKDGNPKNEGFYFTIDENDTERVYFFDGRGFHLEGFDWPVTHWLEPVSLPTEEEINKVANSYDNSMSSMAEAAWMPQGFKEGLKWLKSRLTNSR